MYSPRELHDQRELVLVKKIEYLREEKKLTEMSVVDIKLRGLIVSDIVRTIRAAGMELGGHPEVSGDAHRVGELFGRVRTPSQSGEASASCSDGSTAGC